MVGLLRQIEVQINTNALGLEGIALFGIILLRYFLVAGGAFLLLYSPLNRLRPASGSSAGRPSWPAIQQDIVLSVSSAVIFALAAAFILASQRWGLTRLYIDQQEFGFWYLGISYLAVLLLQDTYFYFSHRLFHHPTLFRWFHAGHHRSRHPTPWTSFAFDPAEALVQALFLVGIVFLIPLHIITLLAVLTTMTVWAVINHLGLDRLPVSFPHHWLGRWFIGPAHHSIHHSRYNRHFGLYFTLWDVLLGTNDPAYEHSLKHQST